MSSPIPIVDLHEFNITKDAQVVSEVVLRHLADQVMDALKHVGFISFRNCGIPQEKVCVVLIQAHFIAHEGVTIKYAQGLCLLCDTMLTTFNDINNTTLCR